MTPRRGVGRSVQHVRRLPDARRASAATIGGLLAGVLVGVLARLDMRIVALARGDAPGFSVAGTIGILVIFALMAMATAAIYTSRPVAPAARHDAWRMTHGIGLFAAVLLLTPLRAEVTSMRDLLLFLPVALAFGPVVGRVSSAVQRLLPETVDRPGRVAYAVGAVPALAALLAVPLLLAFGLLQVVGLVPTPST
jgi:hypothetical protein